MGEEGRHGGRPLPARRARDRRRLPCRQQPAVPQVSAPPRRGERSSVSPRALAAGQKPPRPCMCRGVCMRACHPAPLYPLPASSSASGKRAPLSEPEGDRERERLSYGCMVERCLVLVEMAILGFGRAESCVRSFVLLILYLTCMYMW